MIELIREAKRDLVCLKENHYNEPIQYFCISSTCEKKELCCLNCQQDEHKDHKMISLKYLLHKIVDSLQVEDSSLSASAVLDVKIIEVEQILQELRKQLGDPNGVFNSFTKYAELQKNKALSSLKLGEKLFAILKQNNNPKAFHKNLSNFLHQNIDLITDDQNQSTFFETSINSSIDQFKNILTSLEKFKKQNQIIDHQILRLFPIYLGVQKSFKPYFSQALKAPCMTVTPTTAEMTVTGSQRVVGMQPSLQSGYKIKKWKIKIVKLASWIGVGACHINKLKEATWNFNYSSLQHGNYFISSNGYSWSGYQPEFNSKFNSFTFKTGDTIQLEFNLNDRKLKFFNETTNQNYALDVQINGDPIHPAVNLTGLGDSVQIII